MLGFTKLFLRKEFSKDKNKVINDYIATTKANVTIHNHSKGGVVLVDKIYNVAYSRTDYFNEVIIKNTDYLNKFWEDNSTTILVKLNEDCE